MVVRKIFQSHTSFRGTVSDWKAGLKQVPWPFLIPNGKYPFFSTFLTPLSHTFPSSCFCIEPILPGGQWEGWEWQMCAQGYPDKVGQSLHGPQQV